MNFFRKLPRLPRASGSEPGGILPATWNALVTNLEELENRVGSLVPENSPDISFRTSRQGFTAWLRRRGRPGSSGSDVCHFGEIIAIEHATYDVGIRGGIIHCGDQTWNISPQGINLAASGTWLVSIAVEAEVNRDDDEEILLPGIKTGTRPTGDWTKTAWTEGTDYPDGTAPVVATGLGTIILPIGKLIIDDGVATLEPAGCGHFTIGHCSGTLTYYRGAAAPAAE